MNRITILWRKHLLAVVEKLRPIVGNKLISQATNLGVKNETYARLSRRAGGERVSGEESGDIAYLPDRDEQCEGLSWPELNSQLAKTANLA